MAKINLSVPGYRCERCGHEWITQKKGDIPSICPKCKSKLWNKPKKAEHPFIHIAREVAKTPDVHHVRIYGKYTKGKEIAEFNQVYKPKQIAEGCFKLPNSLCGKMNVFGELPLNGTLTKDMVIEDLNRIRKWLKLDPLPAKFVCEKVDVRHPDRVLYRLAL